MIFDDTKDLLQKTENIILDVRESKKRWMKKIDKIMSCNTYDFICTGINTVLLKRIFSIAIVFTVYVALFINFSIPTIIVNFVLSLLLAVILAPLTIFSKSLDDDIKSKDVKQVKKEISKRKLSAIEIQSIKDNLLIMKTALEAKTSISRWIITAIWAVFLYFFILYLLTPVINGEPIKIKTLQAIALTPIFILMLYSLERCFARTSRRVFMTLLFALNEPDSVHLVQDY